MALIQKNKFYFNTKDGARIYGEVRGRGPHLVLVYGIACQMNHWVHQIKYLSRYFSVITYDLRGHVKSTKGNESKLSIAGLAEDLLELLDYLDIPSAHLAGHSFGSPILTEFASRFSHRVTSLSLLNGFVSNPMQDFLGLNLPKILLPILKGINQEDSKALQKLWANFVDNPLAVLVAGATGGFNLNVTELKDIEIYTRGVAHLDLNVFLPLFESLVSYNGVADSIQITSPTLIIGGDKDQVTPFKFQQELHQCIRGSHLIKVPYGSHCCQLDFPDYVNLLLKRHIELNDTRLLA